MARSHEPLFPAPKTILDDIKPLSESERKELEEKQLREWFNKTLTELIYHACFNEEFAEKLCNEVSLFSRGNRDYVNIIKKYAVSGSGRYPKLPEYLPRMMLLHYASLMKDADASNYETHEDNVIDELIKAYKKITKREIDRDTMKNIISKAISKEKLEELPEWAHAPILARKARKKA